MSLRSRLESKGRRRDSWRVVIDAAAANAAAARAQDATAQIRIAELANDAELAERSRAAFDQARADLEACHETLEFEALDPDDYEALVARFVGPDGEFDDAAALPALAAACAVDEDLRDEQWWASELTSGKFNSGERAQLLNLLVTLNFGVPGPGLGKG